MNADELKRFERDGFLILPDLLSEPEIEILRQDLGRLAQGASALRSETALRQIYDFHEVTGPTSSRPFRALSRTPRLLGRAKRLLGEDDLYLFQSKANMKNAIDGGIFMWHQDSAHWALDGVPTPNMLTFLVTLEETTELSGCLYFIPGSHRLGVLEQEPTTTWVPSAVTPKKKMLEILRNLPAPVAATGKPGMGAVFHSNIVHASGHNLSGKDRWNVYFVYNPITNKPRPVRKPRPAFQVSTNYEVLTLNDDEAVTALGRVAGAATVPSKI